MKKKLQNKDITGQKYNKLTAIKFSRYDSKKEKSYWIFKCECGKEVELCMTNVLTGNTKSCGCLWGKQSADNSHIVDGTNLKYNIENNVKKKTNKTGVTGVSYIKDRNKYYASICYKGKTYNLGRYNNIEDAIMARKIAEEQILNNEFGKNTNQ